MSGGNDGGPAFPGHLGRYCGNCHRGLETPDGRHATYHQVSGMSLRDYLAGQVMAGQLAKSGAAPQTDKEWARRAYARADAMLDARSKR